MSWILLILGGVFETSFAFCLGKFNTTNGSEAKYWLMGFFACLFLSMFLLYKATQEIPLGTAYAVWTGIGAVGTVTLGILFFNESMDFWRLFFLFLLIVSIIGLKFVS